MKKRDNILRLKYRLEPKENDIAKRMFGGMFEFEILYQDDKITNLKGLLGVFNGWRIFTVDNPYISIKPRTIYLRGATKSKDSVVLTVHDQSLIPSIHKALEEMVKKVYGNCTVVKG